MTAKIIQKAKGKVALECAFCRGRGVDPFELLSEYSLCQVCLGRGEVSVYEPAIECAYCSGTGVHLHRRLTCTVCRGKGSVPVKDSVTKCPACGGKGIMAGEYLPCVQCQGKGVIAGE